MADGGKCPQCGCELTPRDPAGIPLAPQHAQGCTAVADAMREFEKRPKGGR